VEAVWIALGLFFGTYLNWRLVAARLRIYSETAGNSLTLPDYLENRFHDHTHVLRVVAAVFILLFYLFYTSSGLVAGGKLFNAVFGLPYHWAIVTGAIAILLYTFAGGFFAVSWTDLFQGLLMALALLLVPLVAIHAQGGWQLTWSAMAQRDPALVDLFRQAGGGELTMLGVISLLGWGLGYFGQPHILARFKAVSAASKVPAARRIAMGWVFVCMLGALLVGYSGIGYLSPPLNGADSEKVFIYLVELLFHPVVAGICLAAILAAIMSTADSQLLVSAAVIAEDFFKALFRSNAGETQLVWIGRFAVVGITAIAVLLAWNPDAKVLELVSYAWAGFGAAFGPTVLLSLYWRNMTRQGALAGVVVGGVTVVIWKQLNGGVFDLYELVPGFLLSFLAVVMVSRLTGPSDSASQRDFDTVAMRVKQNHPEQRV
jgi:sodium/proline symporter